MIFFFRGYSQSDWSRSCRASRASSRSEVEEGGTPSRSEETAACRAIGKLVQYQGNARHPAMNSRSVRKGAPPASPNLSLEGQGLSMDSFGGAAGGTPTASMRSRRSSVAGSPGSIHTRDFASASRPLSPMQEGDSLAQEVESELKSQVSWPTFTRFEQYCMRRWRCPLRPKAAKRSGVRIMRQSLSTYTYICIYLYIYIYIHTCMYIYI